MTTSSSICITGGWLFAAEKTAKIEDAPDARAAEIVLTAETRDAKLKITGMRGWKG